MGQIWKVAPLIKGVDASSNVSAVAEEIGRDGYRFVIRDIPLQDGDHGVQSKEVTKILNENLGLGLRQHGRNKNMDAAGTVEDQGTTDGTYAAEYAKNLDYEPGATIWYTLSGGPEGQFYDKSGEKVSYESMATYLQNWAAAVKSAGYLAGLFNGPQQLIMGDAIGKLKDVTAYWQAAAFVRTPQTRGYQIYQLNTGEAEPLFGLAGVHPNITQVDYKNQRPIVMLR